MGFRWYIYSVCKNKTFALKKHIDHTVFHYCKIRDLLAKRYLKEHNLSNFCYLNVEFSVLCFDI